MTTSKCPLCGRALIHVEYNLSYCDKCKLEFAYDTELLLDIRKFRTNGEDPYIPVKDISIEELTKYRDIAWGGLHEQEQN